MLVEDFQAFGVGAVASTENGELVCQQAVDGVAADE